MERGWLWRRLWRLRQLRWSWRVWGQLPRGALVEPAPRLRARAAWRGPLIPCRMRCRLQFQPPPPPLLHLSLVLMALRKLLLRVTVLPAVLLVVQRERAREAGGKGQVLWPLPPPPRQQQQ